MSAINLEYDVIVVGGGHAGCEAALIAAKLGMNTALVTMNIDNTALMACNPSVGGPAKGHIVREIDVLGGSIGNIADQTYLQIRQVNTGRGPAVRTLRMQSDKTQYKILMKHTLEKQKDLDLIQGTVEKLLIYKKTVIGIITKTGVEIRGKRVIISAGTFLNGMIHIGTFTLSAGRISEHASIGLADDLKKHFKTGRLKTGTPPRIDSKTVDLENLRIQAGEYLKEGFSHFSPYIPKNSEHQLCCYVAVTNNKTHDIIKKNMHLSPLYAGQIHGTGPRYCPSIEDKVKKFSHKEKHKVFIEPEGNDVDEWYLQGLSSSLPEHVQYDIVHSIKGLENAVFYKPAYAIEYDYIFPQQLYHTLETRNIKHLYLTGQINGTSGYEEAACQGLVAGINASLSIQKKDAFVLSRENSYIGILIDDLVSRGTMEPYRMFTARAENRLLLRHNNALYRLGNISYKLGLMSKDQYDIVCSEQKNIADTIEQLQSISVTPDRKGRILCENLNINTITQKKTGYELASRPDVDVIRLMEQLDIRSYSEHVNDEISVNIKYAGYIEKEQKKIDDIALYREMKIPEDINYRSIKGMATEAQLKCEQMKPLTIAEAMNISGVNPVDIYVLIDEIRKLS